MSKNTGMCLSGRGILTGILCVLYSGATLSSIFELMPEFFSRTTPVFLLIISVITLQEFLGKWNVSFYVWFASTFIGLMAIEIAGVKTGFPFGHYSYTSLLGPGIFGVPLIIGLNWIVVLLGAIQTAALFAKKWNKFLKSLSAGVICLIFDIILERVAIKLGYWEWRSEIIPIQNYVAWFALAFLFSLFFKGFGKQSHNSLARINLLFQSMFFTMIIVFKS